MATLRVDTLDFHFHPAIDAQKYDETQHYLNVVRLRGKRAVDVVAVEMGQNPQRAWLLEAKDYRALHGQPKDFTPSEMATDVFRKVTDTQEGLQDAAANAADHGEKSHAARAISVGNIQIVFHLEPYAGAATKLFPRDPTAGVLQKLRQLLRDADPKPMVLSTANTRKADVPWTVS